MVAAMPRRGNHEQYADLTDHGNEHRVTRAEFQSLRDAAIDSNRYELLDGGVLVTPSPTFMHQHAIRRLMALFETAISRDLVMVTAPFDVDLAHPGPSGTLLQPDLVIAPFAPDRLSVSTPPVLVVEVLSSSTWRRDLGAKRDAYAHARIENYWVIATDIPSVTAYRLGSSGAYAEEVHLTGDQRWAASAPIRLELSPAELVR